MLVNERPGIVLRYLALCPLRGCDGACWGSIPANLARVYGFTDSRRDGPNQRPEWYNDSNTTVIHPPKPAQKEKLHMRDDVFEFEDIDLIAGGISLQRGKLPEHVITLADEWLLRASKVERRALRARSNPVT